MKRSWSDLESSWAALGRTWAGVGALGLSWVDMGSFCAVARGAFSLIFYWFLYYFVEIDVFDVKPVPRRSGDEIWPKMTPSWGPKTTPNRSKIDLGRVLGPHGTIKSELGRILRPLRAILAPLGAIFVGSRGVREHAKSDPWH